jgi:hypothetical protein
MEAKRKFAVSIMVMVVLLTTLLATITPVNFTSVLAQDPVSSLTPWVYLPYISRQASSTSEPTNTPTQTSTSIPTNTSTATNTTTTTPTATPTFTDTPTPTSTSTDTPTPTNTPIVGDIYEPDDTPEQANWIESGETQTHSIVSETDIDWVKFSVNTESQVITETSGESGDTVLRLYDSDLNQLEVDYDSGAGSFSRIDRLCGTGQDFLPAGIYYVRIEEWLNNAVIPSYDLTLSINACPSAVVLSNHSSYTTLDSSPSLIVVGEIQNNGIVGIMEPRIVVNLFDDSDQLIDTAIAYTHLARYSWRDSALGAGDKTCFQAEFSEFDGWSYYEFEAPTYSSTGDALENMTVYGDNGTYDPGDGSYRILGFVRNDNEVTVTDVDLIGTLYDAISNVVGCGTIGANNNNLAPGQSSSFELTFSGYYRDYADVDLYRLQVEGMPQ